MSDLREKIADEILCASGADDYLHVSEKIIELVKEDCIKAVDEKLKYNSCRCSFDAIKAIRGIK